MDHIFQSIAVSLCAALTGLLGLHIFIIVSGVLEPVSAEKEDEVEKTVDQAAHKKKKVSANTKKEDDYEVERIVDHRGIGKETEFLLKWKGYSEMTWEPKGNLNADKLLEEYWEEVKKRKSDGGLEKSEEQQEESDY